ncbi:MAG: DUF3365 domain-containing protein [Coriobacteriaceae bacterium]|jgi:signal transduction histidine kinase|nr:DUF3365 domain-containing protein [Coriobacteriaceae bacterium]
MLKRTKIQFKISVLLIVLLAVAMAMNVAWSRYSQTRQAEIEMLEKTQILNQQMHAVWNFIDINQKRIDTDANGEYNFKNIYCALVGKGVAKLFMKNTDYVIRYVSFQPRYSSAYPDSFESAALTQFGEDMESDEYYGITEFEGRDVFRYVSPILVQEGCLECHGEPAGEIDATGHAKEGLRVGEIAGASSIIMPIDIYMEGIGSNIAQQSIIFFIVLAASIAVVIFAISLLVTRPLRRMETAFERMEIDHFDTEFSDAWSSSEILDLQKKFHLMAKRLQALYDNLEDEVADRTRRLVEANEVLDEQRANLEHANALLQAESLYKSDFLAMMSHEFRTPLTSILAYADILERSDTSLSDKEQDAIDEVRENGIVLLTMVNNILEAARVDAGKLELTYEIVDMVDLIATVEGAILPLAERRNIRFATSVDPAVPLIRADWESLRRIVENLASNAVKFTQRGGEASISITNDPQSRGWIAISVSDTGIGIKEEDIPSVFEKFTQVDKSAYRRFSGSGIGLAVVKVLTEAHGGTVEVISEPKQGSTVVVRIPRDRPERRNSP